MKPTILILDYDRPRSPLLTQFYKHISRQDGPFNVVMDGRVNGSVEEIVADRLEGRLPDYIYWGFSPGKALVKSADYINASRIPVIAESGDVDGYDRHSWRFEGVKVRFVIAKWPYTSGCTVSKSLMYALENIECYRGVEIIHVPWGVDVKAYKDPPVWRDIDISFICTVTDPSIFPRHENRMQIRKAISLMEDIPERRKRIGRWFGGKYINLLRRTKIFVVDGSGRKFMVQKYLEGAACGAMLMGDIPIVAKDVFEDGVSISEVNDYRRFPERIRYYLKHDEERKKIAEEGHRRIMEYYAINRVSKEFEDRILEDWRNRNNGTS